MTAAEFLSKLNDQGRSYVDAALDMLTQTDAPGAECAYDWYYKGPGPQQLAAMLPKYPQLPVTGILKALVARQCAK